MLLQQWAQKQPTNICLTSYCNIKKGALMILATMIMTMMCGDPNDAD
jgi:hypothetical protein